MDFFLEYFKVADKKARPYTKYERYNFRSVMYAFTNNKGFDNALLNPIDIEDYFTFALAAGVIRWFYDKDVKKISSDYGSEVELIYSIAEKIVNHYIYPLET